MEGQYATDANLAKRQRLWATARREPAAFDLYGWVLDLCELDGDERVLDVGCGNGGYERTLVARGHRGPVVALDLSHGMRPQLVGDVQQLPFPDDGFDVVLAPHMLYHVPDIPRAAAAARRVLRPGGVFVAVTNSETHSHEMWHLVEKAVGTGWRHVGPSASSFSVENGAAPLATAFDEVTVVGTPPGSVLVEDADLVADYVSSAPEYGVESGVPWDDVVSHVRRSAQAVIDAEGALRLSTAAGAFVCH